MNSPQSSEMKEINESTSKGGPSGAVRYLLAALLCLNCLLIYAMRLNLSVSITAMVNSTRLDTAPSSTETCRDPHLHDSNTTTSSFRNGGEFDWSENEQAMVLYAFFVGYFLTQIPGGYLADRYSVALILGAALGLTSVLSCLTAVAARTHMFVLLAVRFLEGLCEGMWYPCLYNFCARWIPMQERGFLMNMIMMGASVGTFVTMTGSAFLCDSSLGWPASFSVFGIVGIVSSIAWLVFSADGPECHRWISSSERDYIVENRTWTRSQGKTDVPWKEILLSPAVLILNFQALMCNFNFYAIATELPSYLKSIFGIHIIDNGSISGGLALATAISSVICGWAADKVLEKKLASKNFVRKFLAGIGCLVPSICLIIVAQVGCRYEVILGLILINCICQGASGAGDFLVPLDLGPNFPGIIQGLVNTSANVSGFVSPFMVGYFTNNNNTMHQWNLVFNITAVIGATGILVFIFFGSTESQKWNETPKGKEVDDTRLRPAEATS